MLLREIEQRLKVADRLAACIDDPRDPDSIVHTLADIIRFRLLMIAAGYEDGNDAASLRVDPVFKMALERLPSGRTCVPSRPGICNTTMGRCSISVALARAGLWAASSRGQARMSSEAGLGVTSGRALSPLAAGPAGPGRPGGQRLGVV